MKISLGLILFGLIVGFIATDLAIRKLELSDACNGYFISELAALEHYCAAKTKEDKDITKYALETLQNARVEACRKKWEIKE